MATQTPKTGPLTAQDIRDIWSGAVDSAYRQGFEEAGDGRGLEGWGQAWEQLARASLAVDRTTQAMFIAPWSGQSGEPAGGALRASVTLTIARTGLVDRPMVLGAGLFFAEELQLDHSANGSLPVLTGRRYTPAADVVFGPGEVGPLDFEFVAERTGDGYNNPMGGTISSPSQAAAGFYHDGASVLVTPAGPVGPAAPSRQVRLQCANQADMLVPEHVGQYVVMTAGANVGRVARVFSYQGPVSSLDQGAIAALELQQAAQGTTTAGTFQPGELVAFANGGPPVAYGRALGARLGGDGILRLEFVLLSGGGIAPASTATGQVSGATLTVSLYSSPQDFAAEALTAAWRVLGWAGDWGLEISNAAKPAGGRHPWLDELGNERAINRAPGEDDDLYRQRVREIADVVSPNAVRRALNRALAAIPWCFREVGSASLRGSFYDGPPNSAPAPASRQSTDAAYALTIDCYDTDVILVAGTLASGTFDGPPFLIAEEVVLEDASTHFEVARGRFGGIAAGVLTILRSRGESPASVAGLQVRGLHSGAIFDTLTSSTVPGTVAERRWRVNLDYAEFRGFFLVGVPPLGAGEFGFAYDAGPSDAYDASPFDAFYDGAPLGEAATYRQVFHAVDTIKAGGVGWTLYQETGSCP